MKVEKRLKAVILVAVSVGLAGVIWHHSAEYAGPCAILGIVLGSLFQLSHRCLQDLFDTEDWKVSQRKLERGGFIGKDTIIRISFAYLFRIKVGDKYLLVKNERGTGKYQPVGGVYKFRGREKLELKNRFQVMDDNKMPIDQSSRDDYRLRMENRHLRKFVQRFDSKAERESVENLGREFYEELVKKGIVKWRRVRYRVCGRHCAEIRFSKHFQMYELLIADVVELLPTPSQMQDLQKLVDRHSELYHFATAEEIETLGIDTKKGQLQEIIADHSVKILEENAGRLVRISGMGEEYTVVLE